LTLLGWLSVEGWPRDPALTTFPSQPDPTPDGRAFRSLPSICAWIPTTLLGAEPRRLAGDRVRLRTDSELATASATDHSPAIAGAHDRFGTNALVTTLADRTIAMRD
jgi:hypothetical protein